LVCDFESFEAWTTFGARMSCQQKLQQRLAATCMLYRSGD